jgi:hypothetical protein
MEGYRPSKAIGGQLMIQKTKNLAGGLGFLELLLKGVFYDN